MNYSALADLKWTVSSTYLGHYRADMASKQYSIVSSNETDGDDNDISTRFVYRRRRWTQIDVLLPIALIISVVTNLFLLARWTLPAAHENPPISRFGATPTCLIKQILTSAAQLAYDVPTEIKWTNPYNDPDRAVEDAAWSAQAVQPENGFVALDDKYTEAMGLPHSQRSPWFKDKGVYILTSSHEIHCVVGLLYLPSP